MAQFASYYLDFIWSLGRNFLTFWATIFGAIGSIFTQDIPDYFTKLGEAVKGFDVLGWITLLLVNVVNVLLIFAVVYRLVLAIRRYLVFRKRELEKEELLEEVAKLKEQVDQLALEKNQIFQLKMGEIAPYTNINNINTLPGASAPQEAEVKDAVPVIEASRFSKLIAIDEKYQYNPYFSHMTDKDMLSLNELIRQFTYFAASRLKLYFKQDLIRLFVSGLATSKVLILEGISGTGKTSLPYAFAKFFDNNASLVSVQPSWRDRGELLGYLNEFTKKFNETDFLASLYEATYRDDINLIVLDEMNLARIEYYFAEFLSVMEMPDVSEWKIDLIPNFEPNDPKNLIDGKITVPQNLWFIGTANQDDSTFTITDKVYDRAIAISLNEKGVYFDAPVTDTTTMSYDYLESLFERAKADYSISEKGRERLNKLDEFIQSRFKISFGNRIMRQINTFVPVYIGAGGTENDGLDFMVCSKILKKFSSLNLVFLNKELNELIAFIEKLFGKDQFQLCINHIKFLQKNM